MPATDLEPTEYRPRHARADGVPAATGVPAEVDAADLFTLTGVSRIYGSVDGLRAVDLSLRDGAVTGVIGPNGSGKSTLLRLLAGVDRPSSGTIRYRGGSVRVGGIGAYVDGYGLWRRWTVRQNLTYVAALTDQTGRVDEVLEKNLLTGAAGSQVRKLSLGNRARVGLALADVGGSDCVILDEPLNGLDPDVRDAYRSYLHITAASRSLVISSHDLNEIESLCDDLVLLRSGQVQYSGSVADFLADGEIQVVHPPRAADTALHDALVVAGGYVVARAGTLRCRGLSRVQVEATVDQISPGVRVETRSADLEDAYHDFR